MTWQAERGLATGHRVVGALTPTGVTRLPCDLLAVDDAYPEPVADDRLRVRGHQLWRHGEVLVAVRPADGRLLLLVVPGSRIDTETALEARGPARPGRRRRAGLLGGAAPGRLRGSVTRHR